MEVHDTLSQNPSTILSNTAPKPRNTMDEKTIEQKFQKAIKNMGGITIKQTDTNLTGLPDRLVILPGPKYAFIEFKAPGKKPRPQQTHRINQLKKLGCTTYICDNPNHIQDIINAIHTT